MRVKEIVTVGERAHGHADLLAVEVVVRIVRHLAAERAEGESEVSGEEAPRQRPRERGPIVDRARPEEHRPLGNEPIEGECPWRLDEAAGVERIERRGIGGEDRLAATGRPEHRDQRRIPAFDEAVVRVELQRVLLAVIEPLGLVARPARPPAVAIVDVDDAEAPIVGELR